MRFFTTLEKAGRLEYFLVSLAINALMYLLVRYVLGLAVSINPTESTVPGTGDLAFNSGAIPLFLVGATVAIYLSVVNICRRLKDLRMGYAWALLLFVPIVGFFFSLYLLFATGIESKTYTPYGDDPYDPNSWVPPETSNPGPAVTYQGKGLFLPGEVFAEQAEQAEQDAEEDGEDGEAWDQGAEAA